MTYKCPPPEPEGNPVQAAGIIFREEKSCLYVRWFPVLPNRV